MMVGSFTSWHDMKSFSTMKYFTSPVASVIRGRALTMSSRQPTNAANNMMRKKQIQPLITTLDKSRIRIGGQRWILPGDYIVHEEYGVGRYINT